jgi:hypothetical protein
METFKLYLTIAGGIIAILLFGCFILFSLNKQASRFVKYLLAYAAFIAGIGLLLYLFPKASVYIAILAVVGWMLIIVMGSRKLDAYHQDPPDPE